ncbi:MAG: major facilitator superfamily domain-containing protein [Monoraphidium minutum]|nr:MAG: major facilitator superfamily domain-containing protein [Monoraphidium minutum]
MAPDTDVVDDAIERCGGFGRFQWFILFFAGLSWMCDALEVMLMSFLGPAVKCEWGLSETQISSLTSVVFAGMTVGGPLWGSISDGFGRRNAFAMSVTCTTLFGFLSAAAPSFEVLLVFRFFVGLGIPGACVSFGLLMEFVPAQTRGFFLIAIEGFWTIGTILQAGLAYALLNDKGWRILVIVSAVPLVMQLVLLPFVPESPRYLLVKGKTDKAEASLRRVLRMCGKPMPEGSLKPLKSVAAAKAKIGGAWQQRAWDGLKSGFWDIVASVRGLFSRELRAVTASLLFIWFVAAFVYYGLVQLIANVPFMEGGQKYCDGARMIFPHQDLFAILITSVAELPGLLFSLLLAQFLSRKHAFAIPMACIALVLVPLMTRRIPTGGIIACLWLSRFFVYAAYNLLWAITPELFPTSCRSFALGITNAISRIGGLISPFASIVAPKQAWEGSAEAIFAAFSLAAAAAIYLIPRDMNHQRVQDTMEEVRVLSQTESAARLTSSHRNSLHFRGGGAANGSVSGPAVAAGSPRGGDGAGGAAAAAGRLGPAAADQGGSPRVVAARLGKQAVL